jgi:hypothetical protein
MTTNGNTSSYGSVVASIDDGKGKAWDEENAMTTTKSVDSIASSGSSSSSNSSGRNKKHALMFVTGCLVVSGVLGYKTDFSSPSASLLSSSSSSSSASSAFDLGEEATERMKKQYEQGNSLERMVLESLSTSLAPLSSSSSVSKWHRWSGETIDNGHGINILFVKTIKTGSTTIAGLCRRIASRHGINGALTGYNQDGITEIDDKHEPYVYADHMMFKNSEPTLSKLDHPTFLLTSLRDPVSRMISEFQYVMDPIESHSKDYQVPSELLPMPKTAEDWKSRLVTFLNMKTSIDMQYDYISSQKARDEEWSPAAVVKLYDHVIVLERFDESMVVLKNLLGLSNSDLLYLRSKNNEYKWGGGSIEEIKQIVVQYIHGSKDYDLINAASERLDEQISNIPDFDKQLRAYQELLASATRQCGQYTMTGTYPKNSEAMQCLYEDQGCGNTCLTEHADSAR